MKKYLLTNWYCFLITLIPVSVIHKSNWHDLAKVFFIVFYLSYMIYGWIIILVINIMLSTLLKFVQKRIYGILYVKLAIRYRHSMSIHKAKLVQYLKKIYYIY